MPLLHVCHFVVALVTFEKPSGNHGCLNTPESNSMQRQRGSVPMQLLSSALTLGVGVGHHALGLFFWPPSLPSTLLSMWQTLFQLSVGS